MPSYPRPKEGRNPPSPARQKRIFTGKHIKCTHVHDNRLGKDIHHALFTGDSDLVGIRRAFRDIGYDGIFSLELGGAQKMNFVPEVREIYAKYALDSLKVFDALR